MSTKLACSVVPTMEICPNCKSEMTIAEVTPIFLVDGFEDVTYRCKGCRSDMKRTFKRRSGGWELVTLPSFFALRPESKKENCNGSQPKPGLGLRRNAWEQNKDQAMEIEGTTFGTITIDGKTYEHDVIIRLSGEVVKRKKKLSKKYYGTSHVLSKDEAKFVFERGCKQLILGSGQMGNVHLSPEAEAYFAKKGCKVLLQPTPEAIRMFNGSHTKKIGLFHVTC
jgi:hypothetical protein